MIVTGPNDPRPDTLELQGLLQRLAREKSQPVPRS
jgi:hypothetical protein